MAQDPLPDMIPGVIPAIEDAARDYLIARDTRTAIQKEEEQAQDILLFEMKAAQVQTYRTTEGFDCALDVKEKVKVSKPKGEKE